MDIPSLPAGQVLESKGCLELPGGFLGECGSQFPIQKLDRKTVRDKKKETYMTNNVLTYNCYHSRMRIYIPVIIIKER